MVNFFQQYKQFLKADFVAGVTVALILIPQSLAYAQLAGLPPHYGLYAALLPPVLAAFFGSSKQLATGPVAVLSLMTASTLVFYHKPGTMEFISLAILLAFGKGLFQMLLGLFKLGGIVSFLSHPVIYGFTNASALIIASTQLQKFFSVSIGQHEHQYQAVIEVFQNALIHTDWITFLLGIWTISGIIFLKILNKKLPSVLIAVFSATIFSWFIGYEGAIVGIIPSGLPPFAVPNIQFHLIIELLPTILIMGIVGFTEAISVAQAISVKTKDRIDPNKELTGQGMANIIGSFFQSYVVSGSFSRTAVNFQAGAKTGVSSFFTSLIVLLTLLFFTRFLYFLPQVVLAAVIIISVAGLIDPKRFYHIWHTNKYDGLAVIITFLSTVFFAPRLERGIMLGVIFSIGYYLYKNVHPRVVFLSKSIDGTLHDTERYKLARCTNISIVRFDGQLFFGNASFIENEIIRDLAKNPNIQNVVIVGSGINNIDATGEEMLHSLWHSLHRAGKHLYITNLKAQIFDVFRRTGLQKEIGKAYFFTKTEEAIEYLLSDKNIIHLDNLNCPLKKYLAANKQIKLPNRFNEPIFSTPIRKSIAKAKLFANRIPVGDREH